MLRDFLKYQAQTSSHPLGIEVDYARGSYIYDTSGKAYLDFVAGVSANTLGHSHPTVVEAVKKQAEKYMHTMVYGEFAQQPAVELAKCLAEYLPDPLEVTYLVNSGTEAIEGAIKLAKRITGRAEIVAAHHAYHGNTLGALSIMGFEERKRAFRPLMPGVTHITFNNEADLEKITTRTAGVVLETIQGGAGFVLPENDYLKKVRQRCDETGTQLILDEIQPGFGRTGKMFGFEHYEIIPDILVLGKGMGGGMPIGAFVSAADKMALLQDNPKLGHITTFGGNPVVAAAALATWKKLTNSTLIQQVNTKETLFREQLQHPEIVEIRGKGLMLAPLLKDAETATKIIVRCKEEGLLLFGLLFEEKALRITPPLTVSEKEIACGCSLLIKILNELPEKD